MRPVSNIRVLCYVAFVAACSLSSAPSRAAEPERATAKRSDLRLAPIADLKLKIDAREDDEDEMPEDVAPETTEVPVVMYGTANYRESFVVPVSRPASQFCHGPLYFEEFSLERYGRSFGPVQPVVSAAHFFVTLPALPYLTTARRPYRCYYFDDPYGAGRAAPFVWKRSPLSPAAGIAEAGVITGLIFLIP